MTDIGVYTTQYQVENRAWLLSAHGTEDTPSVVLDVSTFTQATHFPNGFLKSGIVLGVIAASTGNGKLVVGPYDDTAVDGRQTASGILFSSVKVPDLTDLTKDPGGAQLVHGFVDPNKLPIANGAAGRGYLDANGQADLKLIHFSSVTP